MALPLASYKLRFHEGHVRAMPARDEAGVAFGGPGVDLRGEEARAILGEAGPIRAWLEAREPGVVLRSVSVDRARPRILVTLEAISGERPRVVRIDAPDADDILAAVARLEHLLGEACARKLRAR